MLTTTTSQCATLVCARPDLTLTCTPAFEPHQLRHRCPDAHRKIYGDSLHVSFVACSINKQKRFSKENRKMRTRRAVKFQNSADAIWHLCILILESSAKGRVTWHSPHSCGHFGATGFCLACLLFVQIVRREGSQCAFNGFPTTTTPTPSLFIRPQWRPVTLILLGWRSQTMTSFPSFKRAAVKGATTTSQAPLGDLLLRTRPGLSHKSCTHAFDVAEGRMMRANWQWGRTSRL